MQFQVPQFIETEDKIVGPLTLKQFLYLAASGAICFMFFFLVKPWLWFILAALIGGLGAALAFIKVEGRPLPEIMLAGLKFMWNPQQYVWQTEKKVVVKAEPKTERGISLENVVAGFALKSAWRTVQTGSKPPAETAPAQKSAAGPEKYEVFRSLSGDKRAARRVDYR